MNDSPPHPSPPSLLLIFTDQHRFDFLGRLCPYPLATPNLDRLAERSVRFDAAYCAAPICGPSRASFFTGLHTPEHGAVRNWLPRHEGLPLLSGQLSEVGYQTALVGKLHLHPSPEPHGFEWRRLCDSPHGVYDEDELIDNPYRRWIEAECFDGDAGAAEAATAWSEHRPIDDPAFWVGRSWCDDRHHMTTWTGDESVRFLRETRDGQRPFFLNVSFFGPHHPYRTCEPWDSLVDPADIELPDDFPAPPDGPVLGPMMERRRKKFADWDRRLWQEAIAAYCGAVAQIDREVGRVLDELEAQGLADNTVVAFTADHGDHIGDMGVCGKGDFSEASARVPFLLRAPGVEPGDCASPVNLLDLRATLADFAGLNAAATPSGQPWSGSSLRPLLEHPPADANERETHGANSTTQPDSLTTMLRRGDWKLTRAGGSAARYELVHLSEEPFDRHATPFQPETDPNHRNLKQRLDGFHEHQLQALHHLPETKTKP